MENRRPRHYAAEIANEPDQAKRKAVADQAPVKWLGMIRKEVECIWHVRRANG